MYKYYKGTSREPHTAECRAEFAEAMRGANFQYAQATNKELEQSMRRNRESVEREGEREGKTESYGGEASGSSSGVSRPREEEGEGEASGSRSSGSGARLEEGASKRRRVTFREGGSG